ncbi:MAG: hypothetical protein GTN40_05450 [Candidatus Aenigmarchaeota archaeon]|nr:hypothetical protein [Candidatus Aenigmarchaeota archaeon]
MRGLLYSIMAALIIIPLFSIIFFYSQIGQENIDISIRANELKYFVDSIEADLNRFMEITGKRALISAVSNITVSGIPLDDAQIRLRELIENGTLKGAPSPLVDTDNLNTWEGKIGTLASNSGFYLTFEVLEMNVTQNDSFNILFEIKGFVNISDLNAKMGVIRNITATSIVSIDNIEDPLFPLNTLGRVFRVIRYYNFTNYAKDIVQGTNASLTSVSGNATIINSSDLTVSDADKILVTDIIADSKIGIIIGFKGVVAESDYVPAGFSKPYIVGAPNAMSLIQENERIYLDPRLYTKKVWDLQNLTSAIRNGYYKSSDKGPSFLDRLEGRLSLSDKYNNYGLESFVDLPEISQANLEVDYTLSCVDYEYWKNTTGRSIRNGAPGDPYDPVFNWFKIDLFHQNIYGVNEL